MAAAATTTTTSDPPIKILRLFMTPPVDVVETREIVA